MLAAAVGNPQVVIASKTTWRISSASVTGVERLTDVRTHSARRLLRDSKCQLDQALRTLVERACGLCGDGQSVEPLCDLRKALAERDVDLRKMLAHRPIVAHAGSQRCRLTSSAVPIIYNQMVVESHERGKQTDRLFFALSDATRRGIVTQTLDRERSVSELGRLYPISLTAVQKHVEVLVDAGLVSKHRSGREQLVRGEVNQLRRAHELLDELEALWRARLERFEGVLNETTRKESE